MKKEQIQELFKQFENICYIYNGIECWSARELQKLLGYSKWENFEKVIIKAKDACRNAGEGVTNHFPDVRKTIPMPSAEYSDSTTKATKKAQRAQRYDGKRNSK